MAKRYKSRKRIDGKEIRNAHYVWNQTYPDDPIKPGDGFVIHHKDGDKKNDAPDNLEKLPDPMHRSEHGKLVGVKTLRKWEEENPEEARKNRVRSAKKMLATLKADPVRYAEWQRKRKEGTIKANKARRLPEKERRRCRAAYMREYRKRKKEGGGADE